MFNFSNFTISGFPVISVFLSIFSLFFSTIFFPVKKKHYPSENEYSVFKMTQLSVIRQIAKNHYRAQPYFQALKQSLIIKMIELQKCLSLIIKMNLESIIHLGEPGAGGTGHDISLLLVEGRVLYTSSISQDEVIIGQVPRAGCTLYKYIYTIVPYNLIFFPNPIVLKS